MTLQATVSLDWVNLVLAAAAQQGVPRQAVLRAAGLSAAEQQAARWPLDHVTRLWRAAVRCTQDSGFGLKAGAAVGPESFDALGDGLRAAATLREAIGLVQKYQRLISDGGRLQLINGVQSAWVVYHPRQAALAFSPHQIEAVLAAVAAFARRVTGRRVRPLRVQFNQPRIGTAALYQAVFQCPVDFDEAFSGVQWASAVLDAPLPQADARLARQHQQRAAAELAALQTPRQSPQALAQALRRWVDGHLQAVVQAVVQADVAASVQAEPQAPHLRLLPTRAQAAQALGLSPRTLARRMQAQQLDFSTVLDHARRDAALHAVAHSTTSLADIGQALGFAEPSTFWRAFKRWTGQTPAQWRRAVRVAPAQGTCATAQTRAARTGRGCSAPCSPPGNSATLEGTS